MRSSQGRNCFEPPLATNQIVLCSIRGDWTLEYGNRFLQADNLDVVDDAVECIPIAIAGIYDSDLRDRNGFETLFLHGSSSICFFFNDAATTERFPKRKMLREWFTP